MYQNQNQFQSFGQSHHSSAEHSEGETGLLKNVRKGFVRKVFSILSIQLAFTALMILMSQSSPSFRRFQIQNSWLLTLSSVTTIGISLSMYCFQQITKIVPYNYMALGLFTLGEGYIVSAYTTEFEKIVVLKAALLTAGATLMLFVYACTTKKDITIFNSILFLLLSSILVVSLINFFVRSNLVMILMEYAAVIVYSFYLIYDIQLIMGQKSIKLDLDNYILGSLIVYVDIIQLFVKILSLFGKSNEEEKEKKSKKN